MGGAPPPPPPPQPCGPPPSQQLLAAMMTIQIGAAPTSTTSTATTPPTQTHTPARGGALPKGRGGLLAQIALGQALKKAVTVDKSTPACAGKVQGGGTSTAPPTALTPKVPRAVLPPSSSTPNSSTPTLATGVLPYDLQGQSQLLPPYYPFPRGKLHTRGNIWSFTVG